MNWILGLILRICYRSHNQHHHCHHHHFRLRSRCHNIPYPLYRGRVERMSERVRVWVCFWRILCRNGLNCWYYILSVLEGWIWGPEGNTEEGLFGKIPAPVTIYLFLVCATNSTLDGAGIKQELPRWNACDRPLVPCHSLSALISLLFHLLIDDLHVLYAACVSDL